MPKQARLLIPPRDSTARRFIFASGFENSYPIVEDRSGRERRRDGMEMSRHYQHWREDLRLVKELGIDYLRYGPPYYLAHTGPMRYDWDFADKTFAELRRLGIHPITDLCHFGVPDWAGGFQNPEWPPLFADYARAFAQRFDRVRLYTPVNEIFVAAEFSAKYGWWNERLKSDRAFVTAIKHLARANVLAAQAILGVQPEALFIQSESSTYFHPANPGAQVTAEFLNQRRFLSLDLSYGFDLSANMLEYLLDNGMSREEYHWFLENGAGLRPHCIMGTDYYMTNEKEVLDDAGTLRPCGEVLGYYPIAKEYFTRYGLPVMHTETNRKSAEEAPQWLMKEWYNVLRLKSDGIPILGFTWYSVLDQIDWDVALREFHHRINPLGLYDLNRNIRKVGEVYRDLIRAWRDRLPLQSVCRDMLVRHREPYEKKKTRRAAKQRPRPTAPSHNGRRR